VVPDAIFADRRLAAIYDQLDADRRDLDAYVAIVHEFEAQTVLDVGCGTGNLACMLARRSRGAGVARVGSPTDMHADH